MKQYGLPAVRDAVVEARTKNWGENDDFGEGFFRSIARYGEVGVEGASVGKIHHILTDMIAGWDVESQEETCFNVERELRNTVVTRNSGSYRGRRVT